MTRLLAVALLFFAAACGGALPPRSDTEAYNPAAFLYADKPIEDIYNAGLDRLLEQDYYAALDAFTSAEDQYPYSVWAHRATLMRAYISYVVGDFQTAAEAAGQFIALHPANKNAPYAHYLRAVSLYEQISDIHRSQETTEAAFNALNALVTLFPLSDYASDARIRIAFVRSHLAARQMYLGRYHMWRGNYGPAAGRFQNILRSWSETAYTPEALYRLAEIYLALGLEDEALRMSAILGKNFPANAWYKEAYDLLARTRGGETVETEAARRTQ